MEIKITEDLSQEILDVVGKQDTLVSGTNIKTINSQSILGSGNIVVSTSPEVAIQATTPTGNEVLWVDTDETIQSLGTEVINSLTGDETYLSPSVAAVNNALNSILSTIYPVGSIIIKDNSTDYSNWLGFTWAKVFAGKVIVGQDIDDTDFDTIGEIGGTKSVSLTESNLPTHSHTYSATTSNQSNNHTHDYSATTSENSSDHTHSGTTSINGAHTHNATHTNSTGSGYESYREGSSETKGTSDYLIASNGDHSHTFTTGGISANHTHSVSGTTGNQKSSHNHTVSGTTASIGSNAAHNNLQPYQVVAYWKRTA